jgi:hypothetical protein
MYSILFRSSRDTLDCFGKDESYLGADLGCIGILHTWGQTLDLHPHIHYIVPAGGVDSTGSWRHTRSEGKYLFPVKVMSTVFRGKFVSMFKEFLASKGLDFSDELHHGMYHKSWVVYAKRPFGGASQVIEYLGRYTHKIAISNHRIQRVIQTMLGDVKLKKDSIIYLDSGYRIKRCRCCGKGEMHVVMCFGANAPPPHNMFNSFNNSDFDKNN